ncbi:MAG TPA: hypothetical protein PK530_17995, partial [Anaerolineales bacterium]|nr:hypothetical protein [Anaerolineales bacterium]
GCACGTMDKAFEWTIDTLNGFVEVIGTGQTRNTDWSPGNYQGLAMSPTGNIGIGTDYISLIPYLTEDGGATWDSISGVIAIGSDVWENCKDDYRWIFGGGMVVKLTMDRGATAPIDKLGNLLSIAPLIDVAGLRFIE